MNFFSAFLEMFRNSDQFIAHMSAEYGIYVYLFLFTVYFLETGIVICALLPGDSLIFVSGAASAAGILKRLHGRLGPIDDETENAVLPRVGGGEAAHGNAGALEEVEHPVHVPRAAVGEYADLGNGHAIFPPRSR